MCEEFIFLENDVVAFRIFTAEKIGHSYCNYQDILWNQIKSGKQLARKKTKITLQYDRLEISFFVVSLRK